MAEDLGIVPWAVEKKSIVLSVGLFGVDSIQLVDGCVIFFCLAVY